MSNEKKLPAPIRDEEEATHRPFSCRIGGSDPVRLFIRPMTADEARELRERHMRASKKLRSVRNQTLGQFTNTLEAVALDKAILVLGGSEDWALSVKAENREAFTKETGLPLDADGIVLLPREWPEGLKRYVFKRRPVLIDFVCAKTDELTGIDEEEEAEETGSFR